MRSRCGAQLLLAFLWLGAGLASQAKGQGPLFLEDWARLAPGTYRGQVHYRTYGRANQPDTARVEVRISVVDSAGGFELAITTQLGDSLQRQAYYIWSYWPRAELAQRKLYVLPMLSKALGEHPAPTQATLSESLRLEGALPGGLYQQLVLYHRQGMLGFLGFLDVPHIARPNPNPITDPTYSLQPQPDVTFTGYLQRVH